MSVCTAVVLFVLSLIDIKKKEIPVIIMGFSVIILLIAGIFTGSISSFSGIKVEMCFALILMVVSVLSNERLGLADAITVGTLALIYGLAAALLILVTAFLLLFLFIMISGKGENYGTAFIPFIFAGFAIFS